MEKGIVKKLNRKPNLEESVKIYSPIEFTPQKDIDKLERGYSEEVVNLFINHV